MSERHAIIATLNGGRGSGAVVKSQIEGFLREGTSVTSVSTQPIDMPGVQQIEVPLDGRPIPIHDYLPGSDNTVPVYDLAEGAAEVYKELFKTGIDQAVRTAGPHQASPVLVVHHANVHLAAAQAVAEQTGVPYLVQPHGTCIEGYEKSGKIAAYEAGDPAGNVWKGIRQSLNNAGAIIAISQFMRETQIDPHVDDPAKVHVIFNPLPSDVGEVDPSIVDQLIAEEKIADKPYVLQMGIMADWKRPQDLAAASHRLPDSVQTLFVGHDAGMAERVVAEGKNCIYLGPVYGPRAKGLMARAAVLAVSSVNEPFGLTPIEAGSLGVHAVVRPSGAPQEFIRNGFNGYVAEDVSVDAYGEAVRRAVETPPQLQGDQLSQYTQEAFGYANTTKRVIDLAHNLSRE